MFLLSVIFNLFLPLLRLYLSSTIPIFHYSRFPIVLSHPFLLSLDSQFLHQFIECWAADAQFFCRFSYVSLISLERPKNKIFFQSFSSFFKSTTLQLSILRDKFKILWSDFGSLRHDHSPPDSVFQFSYISGPVIRFKRSNG